MYVYGPSAIQDHHGVEKGGGVKHVRVVCHDVSGEGGRGGGSAGGLCHGEEAFEWQQLASEESTNHKNDHILDKETNGETT